MVVPRRPLIVDVFRRHVGRIHDALAWRVAFAYEPMARANAVRFMGCGLDFEDLVQEGLIGMHRAAQLYDPTKGPLSTHLRYRSKAAMIDAIVCQGHLVRIPKWADQAARRIQRGAGDLGSSGTAKRRECILAAIDLRAREICGDDDALADVAEPDRSTDLESSRKALEMVDRLDDPAEREVIFAHYVEGIGPSAIGRRLGLDLWRVKYLKAKALAKLRTMFADIAAAP